MILGFHQVTAEADPLATGTPDAALFEKQMTWLAELCNVLPLPEAVARLRAGTLPACAACVTFDDGYANNAVVAVPILVKLGLPATFFVTGGAIDHGIMWNDLVVEGIRLAGDRIDLRRLNLGTFDLSNDSARLAAIASLLDRIKYMPLTDRLETAQAIFEEAGGDEHPRLMMTRHQVSELSELGFDIGAHTLNHPILKGLGDEDARAEIVGSRDWIEAVTGKRPVSFAYPNGRPGIDYGERDVGIVAEAGFEVAVSTFWGCAAPGSAVLELPRFTPWEQDRAKFGLRLIKTVALSYR